MGVLVNDCHNCLFCFVLINEIEVFLCICEAESHVIEKRQWLFLSDIQYMTAEEFLHLIYITCGKFLLQLLPVSGGNNCHSLVI